MNYSHPIKIKAVLGAVLAAGFLISQSAQAIDLTKLNNTSDLNLAGSYTQNLAPTVDDTIVYGALVTASNTSAVGAGGVNVYGLNLTSDVVGNVTINSTSGVGMTLGQGGLNKNNSGTLVIGDLTLSANQVWNINNGTARANASISFGGHSLEIAGAGTWELRSAIVYGPNVTLSVNALSTTQGTTDVTLQGANTFSLLNLARGRVSGATFGNSGDASNFGSGNITIGTSTGVAGTMRYTGVTATSDRGIIRGSSTSDAVNAFIEVSTVGQTLTINGNLTSNSSALNGGWGFKGVGNLTIGGVISNQGSGGNTFVNKDESGTLTLTGENSYLGNTTVSAGTLLVNNALGSGLGGGNAIVNGGTIGGTGSFTGAVTVNSGGTLSPGASIQSLGSGTLTLNNNSTFEYEVDSTPLVVNRADLQKVTGDLNLNGTVTLSFDDLNVAPTAFALGTTFTLINYSGTWNNGLFTYNAATIADGGTFNTGLNLWQLDYNATSGGTNFASEYAGGNFVNITAVVPEPSTFLLLAFGGVATLVFRRRRA